MSGSANKNLKATVNKRTRKRMLVIFVIFILLGVVPVFINLFYVQIVKHDFYLGKATTQQMRNATITPARGTIYDRNMKKLAVSATVETVYINPSSVESDEQAELIADGLSDILGVDRETVLEKTKKKNYYEIIKRKVEKEEADRVREFKVEHKLKAIELVEDTKRYYPYGNFASSVIGFVGTDNYGLQGVEAYYDEELQGLPGKITSAKNASGTAMPLEYEQYIDPENGKNLVLTIDEVVQHYVEKHLENAVIEHNVQQRGAAIVMNVKTGEILALANKPDYDLNDPFALTDEFELSIESLEGDEYNAAVSEYLNQIWRNKVVSDTYEPGSVFKTVTAAIGLEEKKVSLDSTFYCPGYYMVGKTRVGCWKHAGHGSETFLKGLENSCNPVFMQVGLSIGTDLFYKYFDAFGLREKTGIDLPGEAEGIPHTYENLSNPISLATSSFGQTFKVTPIQMLTAVAAVTNGGYLVQPHVAKEFVDDNGVVIQSVDTTPKRQVISAETSATVANMMEQVVSSGTGGNAYLQGYRIGGKTATSEKTDQRDENGQVTKYSVSVVGIAPADDPMYAILVMLDEPNTSVTSGGQLVAPVVRNIFNDILPYLGVVPQYTPEELANLEISVPNVIGSDVKTAKTELSNAGFTYRIEGEGQTVVDQVPKTGERLSKGSSIILYTAESATSSLIVPDVIGCTPAEAKERLEAAGFNIKEIGTLGETDCFAVKQSLAHGTAAAAGTVVEVTFLKDTHGAE